MKFMLLNFPVKTTAHIFLFFTFILSASSCTKKNYAYLRIPAQPTLITHELNKEKEAPLTLPIQINQAEIDRIANQYAFYKANIQKVVAKVRSFIGTKYLRGGISTQGVDCSGLVYACLASINIPMGRTPEEQAHQGKIVEKESLQVGDLVFFKANKESFHIAHVGIVTEIIHPQKVLFVHASTTRGVVEDNFYHYHWQSVFIQAVRPDYYKENAMLNSLNK